MVFRIILIAAFVAGIAYVAITYQSLWIAKDTLTDANKSLTTQLADTTNALKTARGFITGQEGVISGLIATTANQSATIATLKLNAATAQTRALQQANDTRQSDGAIGQQIAGSDAKARKVAADEYVAGVGPVATTVNDTAANRQFATLKGVIKNRDNVVVPGLVEANEQLSQQLVQSKQETSDLEDELNGVKRTVIQRDEALQKAHNADADIVEEANAQKHVFGIGKGKTIQKAANKIRAGKQ